MVKSSSSAKVPIDTPTELNIHQRTEISQISEKIAEKIVSKMLNETIFKTMVWIAAILISFVIGNLWNTFEKIHAQLYQVSGQSEENSKSLFSIESQVQQLEQKIDTINESKKNNGSK